MASLTVVATIKAKAGSEELVYAELRRLIPTTLAEEGCINYDLHRSTDEPHVFLFYENWTSRSLWEQHMQAAHLVTYMQNTEGHVEVFELFAGERIANS